MVGCTSRRGNYVCCIYNLPDTLQEKIFLLKTVSAPNGERKNRSGRQMISCAYLQNILLAAVLKYQIQGRGFLYEKMENGGCIKVTHF